MDSAMKLIWPIIKASVKGAEQSDSWRKSTQRWWKKSLIRDRAFLLKYYGGVHPSSALRFARHAFHNFAESDQRKIAGLYNYQILCENA